MPSASQPHPSADLFLLEERPCGPLGGGGQQRRFGVVVADAVELPRGAGEIAGGVVEQREAVDARRRPSSELAILDRDTGVVPPHLVDAPRDEAHGVEHLRVVRIGRLAVCLQQPVDHAAGGITATVLRDPQRIDEARVGLGPC